MSWDKSKKKWIVNGRESGKILYLGNYDTLEEAKAVREAHVRRVYGSNGSTIDGEECSDQSRPNLSEGLLHMRKRGTTDEKNF